MCVNSSQAYGRVKKGFYLLKGEKKRRKRLHETGDDALCPTLAVTVRARHSGE